VKELGDQEERINGSCEALSSNFSAAKEKEQMVH
jgi:hypothetical protein